MGRIRRLSEVGIYHVYLRGNSKNIIFYDNQDRIQFCKRLEKFSLVHDVKFYAYVLMDNHIHLLLKVNVLKANALSDFVSSVMKSFVCWYNRKYKLSDRLCQSPFNSAPKNSIEKIKCSLVYVLQNPVKVKMCTTPFEYKWSSANMYFKTNRPSSYLSIDTAFVETLFSSEKDFREILLSRDIEDSEIREKEDTWARISHSELCLELSKILQGRFLSSLSKAELKEVSSILIHSTNASYGQIASLLHVSYDFVRGSTQDDTR
ncbi:MAG: transposase [Bacteroidales bacterium]